MTPTPYDPNVSPALALYVERCRVPVEVRFNLGIEPSIRKMGYPDIWEISGKCYTLASDATKAYTAMRDRLMSERGQLTNEVV